MALIRVNYRPSRADLAVFGLCWLLFFGCWGGMVAWRHPLRMPAAWALWGAALTAPLIGLLNPEFLRILYVGTSYLAYPIGLAVSFILLAVLYFLVFTPIGFVMRLFGHDPMQRRFDHDANSYWIAREQHNDKSRYFKQF
ncbi:MAG: SxtJ family membrane protein [Thermoguttaceae bacterium]|jgi:hypothetical protein